MPAPSCKPASVLVEKIRALLAARGLSLADLVRKSRLAFPNNRHRHIPHNLYDAIRKRRFSPSVCQIATLSLLSGYRFVDWLAMFGLSLDQVARFQVSFPAPRTVELDARSYHPRARVPWFRDLTAPSLPASLTPVSGWPPRSLAQQNPSSRKPSLLSASSRSARKTLMRFLNSSRAASCE